MNGTTDNRTIQTWIREIVPKDKIDLANEIASWTLDIGTPYKQVIIKAHKTEKSDVRFCIDRGNDCLGQRIYTNFFILSRYGIEFITNNNGFHKILFSDSEFTWNKTDIEKIISDSFYVRAKKMELKFA